MESSLVVPILERVLAGQTISSTLKSEIAVYLVPPLHQIVG